MFILFVKSIKIIASPFLRSFITKEKLFLFLKKLNKFIFKKKLFIKILKDLLRVNCSIRCQTSQLVLLSSGIVSIFEWQSTRERNINENVYSNSHNDKILYP